MRPASALLAPLVLLAVTAGTGAAASSPALATAATDSGGSTMSFEIRSPSFEPGGAIPRRFTCEGADVSPALSWAGVPPGTRSLALIVDDPDAPDPEHPRTIWVHWVLYNLPADAGGLAEEVAPSSLPAGTREGLNDWKRTGWGGPCPPVGRHRYFFKLYALDAVLPDLGRPSKAQLEEAMQGHVLAHTEVVGTYRKSQ